MKINLDFNIKDDTIHEFKKVMLPDVEIETLNVKTLEENSDIISLELSSGENRFVFTLKNYSDKMVDQKIVMIKAGLLKLFKKVYPWGALMGVRPTKLVRRFLIMGYSYEEIDEILEKLYFAFPEKRKLLIDVVKKESLYLNDKAVNMYIGIPYCPTTMTSPRRCCQNTTGSTALVAWTPSRCLRRRREIGRASCRERVYATV